MKRITQLTNAIANAGRRVHGNIWNLYIHFPIASGASAVT